MSEEFADVTCDVTGKREVIRVLRQLEMPAKRKKDALMEWGAGCNVAITAVDYARVTGYPSRPW